MSYILKALQRAEAERARGATPGLLTPTLPAAAEPAPAPRRVLPWSLAGGALAGCAALAWWLWPAEPQPVAVAPAVAPAQAVPPAVHTAPVAAPTAPLAQAVPPAPIVAAPPVPAPAPAPASAVAPLPRPAAPTPAPGAATARATPPVASPAGPAAAPAAATAQTAPVVTLAELPPQLRQALPPLTLGGGIYSPEAANRLLIVNGQVMREKAQIAPDLVLESIGPRSAVFRFRQQRFEMKY
jgi:general secretion pathway protein B